MNTSEVTLTNNGTYQLGDLSFWALGDRVIIEEDEFKTGYECASCNGSGKRLCDECRGSGYFGIKKCSQCDGGRLTCQECNGKGGLLIAPDIAQRRPTTGKLVSTGEGCKVLKVGQSVMYSNHAGYVVDLARAGRTVTLRILHESEVLCGMDGHLQLRNFKGKTEVAEFGG